MIIGVDLDGTLTTLPLNNTQSRLPWFFGLCLAVVPPNRKMVTMLQKREAAGDRIIFVSSRPEKLEKMTRWQLRIFRVPYSEFILVGVGGSAAEKKMAVFAKKGIEIYIDDNKFVREAMREKGFIVYSPREFLERF